MNFNDDQKRWFDSVRAYWNERIVPDARQSGQNVFQPGAPLSQAAVKNARVFADRIAPLGILPANALVAELGTQTGGFAGQILNRLNPRELHLFDLEFETLRNTRMDVATDARVKLHLGDSSTNLNSFPDEYFDWIYIDGDHSQEGVRKDANVAVRKVKSDGILIFNDYTIWSPLEFTEYGIVPVVNDLLTTGGWEMLYIALHPMMYCDVALIRPDNTGATARSRRRLIERIRNALG